MSERSSWPQIAWSDAGKYLGFWIGPGKGHRSWDKPAAKFHERLGDWRWGELGLHDAMSTYGTYVLPVLLFVAQLKSPPPAVLALEEVALRRIAPGPGFWCSRLDLHHGPELGLGRRLRPWKSLVRRRCSVRIMGKADPTGSCRGVG